MSAAGRVRTLVTVLWWNAGTDPAGRPGTRVSKESSDMKWDFSAEKIIAAVAGVGVYFGLGAVDAPYWLRLFLLIVIIGWGPDLLQRFRR